MVVVVVVVRVAVGVAWWWRGGGVLILEVTKQVPRPMRPGLGQVIAAPLRALEGITQPEPKPA